MDELGAGLALLWTLPVLASLAFAVLIGLAVGLLPGLGGISALALLIPLVYGLEPVQGVAFLLGTHAVVYSGGSVSAVLLGIPGASPNAATVADGYGLTRRGKPGYALGAALTASAVGGVMGGLVLVALLPLLQQIALWIGSPETFLLAVIGLLMVAWLGEASPSRGLVAGGLGILLSCIGVEAISGEARFWLGYDYLLDGIRLVPLTLGLFAVPVVLGLLVEPQDKTTLTTTLSRRQLVQGISIVLRRRGLLVKSALLGTGIGIVPGVGGEAATFIAYGVARGGGRRRRSTPIDGVIAPEGSNNAKEGGALVPTLAFGVPGSAGMGVLLGGLLLLGLEPGPDFLVRHLDLAYAMALIVVVANLLASALFLAMAPWLIKLVVVDRRLLGVCLLTLVASGSYAAENNFVDVGMTFAFGALGWAMARYHYSRAALILGFVLGDPLERYFYISLDAYGPWFWLKPLPLGLIVVSLAMGAVLLRQLSRGR
ncbi:MAG: tripartite tricarboxylate transporter permease [Candidatus Competibacterales bacterium]